LTTEVTVAYPGALAGHPQLKAPGQHATNGARTWGVSNGAWSDDEVWLLKDRVVCPCTSGYLSAEDMKNPHRSTDRDKASEQTLPQRLAQQYSLKSPDDFTASSTVYGEGQAKAIEGDPVLSVTQNQLMEIVRRACHELTHSYTVQRQSGVSADWSPTSSRRLPVSRRQLLVADQLL